MTWFQRSQTRVVCQTVFPLLAKVECPQHRLLGTGIWALLGGCKSPGCMRATLHSGGVILTVPGFQVPEGCWALECLRFTSLSWGPGTFGTRTASRGSLGKALPQSGGHPPRRGSGPSASEESSRLDATPSALGGASRGHRLPRAQVAAHRSRQRRGGPKRIRLPEVPEVARCVAGEAPRAPVTVGIWM